jgi:uroporphyrinogen-III synthase
VELHGHPGAGAEVIEVPVYRWTVPDDRRPALDLITLTCEGGIDALTFTSAPAVHGLFGLARAAGSGDGLLEACNTRVLVACVGPVCGAAASAEGVAGPRWPEHWRLGAMVKMVAEAFSWTGSGRAGS